ncbi:uncharacterized protein LOC143223826 isoform X1 [Tachypleus tridentatus]|uniref:uncharacterized protein LOC143223826 isoform X1 n=1 Tax=Tachypleus tridentatus TaxID=6853 RepID=UPI003FD385CB
MVYSFICKSVTFGGYKVSNSQSLWETIMLEKNNVVCCRTAFKSTYPTGKGIRTVHGEKLIEESVMPHRIKSLPDIKEYGYLIPVKSLKWRFSNSNEVISRLTSGGFLNICQEIISLSEENKSICNRVVDFIHPMVEDDFCNHLCGLPSRLTTWASLDNNV